MNCPDVSPYVAKTIKRFAKRLNRATRVTLMLGNGIANIVAALIIAAALLWSGGIGRSDAPGLTEDEFTRFYARAVGDIRNDIVVNCGCCGDGSRGARKESF